MATRPFDFGSDDYIERLNDLASGFMPSTGAVAVNSILTVENNGQIIPVTATATLTPDESTRQNGWGCIVEARGVTATIAADFRDGATSKTIASGNAAMIVFNGTSYSIFRFSAAT